MPLLPRTLRRAIGRWRRRPALAVIATIVIALGVAATVAMHAVVSAALLAGEPWPEADRLVRIYAVLPHERANPAFARRWDRMPVSWPSWRDLQQSPTFADVAVWVPGQHIVGDEQPVLARTLFASSTLTAMLGIQPAIGRGFTADEDEADSGAIVISHALWMRLFGGDPAAIGRVTTASPPGSPAAATPWRRTIVGVLPEDARFPGTAPDVLFPIGFHRYNGSFGNPFFHAIARLTPGVSTGAGAAAAEPLVRRDEPASRRTARVVALREDRIGLGDRPLWLMLAGAALLLVAACANVAGLLLGDARTRHHEVAVRAALGGSRGAILRLLAAEHAVLAIAAGGVGMGLAAWAIPALTALAPPGVLGSSIPAIEPSAAVLALVAAVLTTTVAGLAPGSILSAAGPSSLLKSGGPHVSAGRRWRHRTVVAAQFGLALVLLVGAGLFGETLIRLGRLPLGFTPDGVAVLSVARHRPTPAGTLTAAEREEANRLRRTNVEALIRMIEAREWAPVQSLVERLSGLPGVTHVATADAAPFSGAPPRALSIVRRGQPAATERPVAMASVSDQYFAALGVPLRRGRMLEAGDRRGSRTAASGNTPVVVSESLAGRLGAADAIGAVLMAGPSALEVVGVVGDVRQHGLTDDETAIVYFMAGSAQQVSRLVVRTAGDPAASLPMLRDAIERHDQPMFVTSAEPLSALVAGTVAVERSRASLAALYGGVALVMATIGLYGLSARLVAERRREIGIRVALGAGRRAIRRLVLTDAWIIVGLGLAAGLPAAIAAARLSEGLLFGVAPAAPHLLAGAAGALAVAALTATAVPAWRATRVDPATTLRED